MLSERKWVTQALIDQTLLVDVGLRIGKQNCLIGEQSFLQVERVIAFIHEMKARGSYTTGVVR